MIQLQFIKTHETSFLSSQNVSVGGKEYTLYGIREHMTTLCRDCNYDIINSSGHYKSKKYKRQCLYIFHNSHNLQINLCTNTYCIDIRNFIPFDEKVILLPDFKNNMFCHYGAR